MAAKILGYFLLIIGLVLIGFSLISIYFVFTQKSSPTTIFHQSSIYINPRQFIPQDVPDQLNEEKLSELAPIEILSQDTINTALNLAAHLIFMGFVSSVGFKLSSLGIQIIRSLAIPK